MSLPTSVVIAGCDSLSTLQKLRVLFALSDRREKSRLPLCWRGLQRLLGLVCINATKRITISTGPITIPSGWGQKNPRNKKVYVYCSDCCSSLGSCYVNRRIHGNNATDGYRHQGFTHCPWHLGNRRLDVGGNRGGGIDPHDPRSPRPGGHRARHCPGLRVWPLGGDRWRGHCP